MSSLPSGIVSTKQLAQVLLLTERRIRQLTQAGILQHAVDPDDGHELKGRFKWVESVQSYIR